MKSENKFPNLRSEEFSALSSIYFNAAYLGPLPKRTQLRIKESVDRCSDPSYLDYSWVHFPEKVRQKIANLVGCSAENLSLNSSTSEAVSAAAMGLNLKPGDHVSLLEGEYPSDVISWMLVAERVGTKIDFLKPELSADPQAFVRALHPQTKVVCLSHVSFQTGSMVNILELGRALHDRDILFFVDITQSFGGMPMDPAVLPFIDVMPCSVYKWMLAPYGQAFCYWSPKALNKIQHTHAGWLTLPDAPEKLTRYTTQTKGGARKFDRGQNPNILGIQGLYSSLELLEEIGLENIYRHNQNLVSHFLTNYSRKSYRLLTTGIGSNIVGLRSETQDSKELQEKLKKNGIDVSVREGNLRISFHLYNTISDVDRLLKI